MSAPPTLPEPSPSSNTSSTPSSPNLSEALGDLPSQVRRLTEAVERLASRLDTLIQNAEKWVVWLTRKH